MRGDGSPSLGIASRGMLTAASLVYAVACTTVVQVLDCRAPGTLARVADPETIQNVVLPAEALGMRGGTSGNGSAAELDELLGSQNMWQNVTDMVDDPD